MPAPSSRDCPLCDTPGIYRRPLPKPCLRFLRKSEISIPAGYFPRMLRAGHATLPELLPQAVALLCSGYSSKEVCIPLKLVFRKHKLFHRVREVASVWEQSQYLSRWAPDPEIPAPCEYTARVAAAQHASASMMASALWRGVNPPHFTNPLPFRAPAAEPPVPPTRGASQWSEPRVHFSGV